MAASDNPFHDEDKTSASQGAEEQEARFGEPFPGGALLDDLARLIAGAGGAAEAAREEAGHVWQTQLEWLKQRLDLVPRESFDAVAEMAVKALEKIEELEARLAKLESSGKGKKQ